MRSRSAADASHADESSSCSEIAPRARLGEASPTIASGSIRRPRLQAERVGAAVAETVQRPKAKRSSGVGVSESLLVTGSSFLELWQ